MEDESKNPRSEEEILFEILNHIKKRPGMYFGDTMSAVDNFFGGFFIASSIWGNEDKSSSKYETSLKSRGLHRNQSIYQQLLEKGHTHDTAIEIYLDIVMELYTRTEG